MFVFHYSFLQLRNLSLLLLNDAPQVFDAVVVGQLVLGHLEAAGMCNVRVFRFDRVAILQLAEALPPVIPQG